MRALLTALIIMSFSAPAFAADTMDAQKPTLIKGSKSYQVRYTKPTEAPEAVEPAAGVEMQQGQTEGNSAVAPSADDGYGKKEMKLHGKK